jgi:hypothetical protein
MVIPPEGLDAAAAADCFEQSAGFYLGKVIACRMLGFTLFSSTSSMVAASGTAMKGLQQRRQVQRHGQQGQHGD